MGKSQRAKGASYEREVAQQFSTALGETFKRNISQARDGGHDLVVGPLCLEMKRRKSLITLRKWMAQASAASAKISDPADNTRYIPAVVTREDNGESMVLISLDDFIALVDWRGAF